MFIYTPGNRSSTSILRCENFHTCAQSLPLFVRFSVSKRGDMDGNKLIDVLRATLDPNQREAAEKQLEEVHKIIGFAPTLIHLVMSDQVDMPVRQAGVIYLKNMITQFWHTREPEAPGDPVPFNIHEQDRAPIRDSLVEAIIQAPEPIRVQLGVCMSNVIKHDFPGRWHSLPEKLAHYIKQDDQPPLWLGALISLYQLVKNYEYKKPEEREPMTLAMRSLLPVVHERCAKLMPEPFSKEEYSVLCQKQILKIFYALIMYSLPLDLLTKDVFSRWMELCTAILDRAVPEQTYTIDEEDRPELAWWKVKKWSLHILVRCFERYGSPGNVMKEYNEFSNWYLKTFSSMVLQVVCKQLLVEYREKKYLSSRVLQQCLNYVNTGVAHGLTWKLIRPHIHMLIRDVVFPVMCHTDEDDELWETDPHEYIRSKYDVFEDFISPVTAAQTLLHSAVSKRKGVLNETVEFCMGVINAPNAEARQKDGALHILGAISDVLLKKKLYKEQAETMLTQHVYKEFRSPNGYLRARACWMLQHYCEVKFKNDASLVQAIELIRGCLCNEKEELPVKVEAAIALQSLIACQEKAKSMMQAHVRPIVLELLKIIRETENDDLMGAMQKLVCTYVNEVAEIAVEMTTHLVETFAQVIESNEDGSDERALTAMGILNTIETILSVMEDHKEILAQLEAIVLNVIGLIFQHNVLEFYEEVLSLIYSLTCQQISSHMWQVFHMNYDMFQKDGFDYFTDMMPLLHNYITVDTPAFLSNPKHLEIIYNMCKTIMTSDTGEDAECHAVKLLEVVILQCRGSVDHVLASFVQLALDRLTREVRTSELRSMCLQVVVAALYYNPALLFDILNQIHLPNATESILSQFLSQWLQNLEHFMGLHDRKVSVLGLCTLINTSGQRPDVITQLGQQLVPATLFLFKGLKKAYVARAAEEGEEGDSDEEGDEDDEYVAEPLESDEDEIDEDGAEYLERLEKVANGEDESDDEDEDGIEETALESYQTPLDDEDTAIDEYQIFKAAMEEIQRTDPGWYGLLTSQLNAEQIEQLKEVIVLADQRHAAQESKRIEQSGGYSFTQVAVPSTFNFTP